MGGAWPRGMLKVEVVTGTCWVLLGGGGWVGGSHARLGEVWSSGALGCEGAAARRRRGARKGRIGRRQPRGWEVLGRRWGWSPGVGPQGLETDLLVWGGGILGHLDKPGWVSVSSRDPQSSQASTGRGAGALREVESVPWGLTEQQQLQQGRYGEGRGQAGGERMSGVWGTAGARLLRAAVLQEVVLAQGPRVTWLGQGV